MHDAAMRRRIAALVTVASMLAVTMALSGVAQARPVADPADAQCLKLAIQTLGPGYNPANYTFIGGTENIDDFSNPNQATAGPDVFCGFGGDDSINTLDEGDIFLGGTCNDIVGENDGTFYGQEGNDVVRQNDGTFNGGDGFDSVFLSNTGIIVKSFRQ
jgi:hypothetical protein